MVNVQGLSGYLIVDAHQNSFPNSFTLTFDVVRMVSLGLSPDRRLSLR